MFIHDLIYQWCKPRVGGAEVTPFSFFIIGVVGLLEKATEFVFII